MKVKVSEAKEQVLDYLVAQAAGNVRLQYDNKEGLIINNIIGWFHYRPSVAWEQGGPIIEREWLDVISWPNESDEDMRWQCKQHDSSIDCVAFGSTPLVAAMRCYVASQLGAEVEVPSELLQS